MTRLRGLAGLVCFAFSIWATPARVAAVPVVSSYFYTSNIGPSDLASLPEGQFVSVVAIVDPASTADSISSLTVVGTQGSLSLPMSFSPYVQGLFPGLYQGLLPLAGAVTSVGWSITASDSTGPSAPSVTGTILNPVALPLATDISVSDASATPTVSWTLPDLTGYSVDDVVRVRVIDADTEVQLLQAELTLDVMSFVVPAGLLTPGRSYVYRVALNGGDFQNTSLAFSDPTRVSEPRALALVMAALGLFGAARSSARARDGGLQ